MDWSTVSLFLSGIFILGIMSWLYKETPFYRVVEHLFIGTAIGKTIIMSLARVKASTMIPLMNAKYIILIPVILGLLYYTQLSNEYRWLSRWPIAISIGTGLGVAVRGYVEVSIVTQIVKTGQLITAGTGIVRANNIILAVFVLLGMLPFFVSVEYKGLIGSRLRIGSRAGRLVLMSFFGVVLANNIMSRLGRMAGIMSTLIEWIGLFT